MNKSILLPVLGIIVAIIFFILGSKDGSTKPTSNISTDKSSSGYQVADREAPEGYRTITAVDGVSFYVVQSAADTATAVSKIANNVSFDTDTYYSYKDGTEQYLLFNMSEMVVAAQKGTFFDFDANGLTESTLKSASVAGIWFDKSGNKLSADKDDDAYIIQANGGVVITNEIYGTYCGKLKVITDGTEEWSIFAGIQGEKYKDIDKKDKEIIDNVVDSIHFAKHKEVEQEVYAVSLGNPDASDDLSETQGSSSPIAEEDTAEPNSALNSEAETLSVSDNTSETPSISENNTPEVEYPDDSVSSDAQDKQEVDDVSDSSGGDLDEDAQSEENPEERQGDVEVIEEAPEVTNPESSESISENSSAIEVPENKNDSEIEEAPITEDALVKVTATREDTAPERGESLHLTNQKKIEKSADSAYTSNIYSMLDIGDSGIFAVYDVERKAEENPIINLSEVITGRSATALIKSYCMTPEATYEFFDPPNGCSWHVAKYSVNYKRCSGTPYVDIRLRGLDGGSLVHRGIKYSSRTHDIHTFVMKNKDGWQDDYYCYYAVPNGCTNYVLEIGGPLMHDTNSKCGTAFYEINTKK